MKIFLFTVIISFFVLSCKTKIPAESEKLPMPQIKIDSALLNEIRTVENEKINIDNSNQNDTLEYFNKDFLRYSNFIYKPNIKTVLLHRTGWDMSYPIIESSKNETLSLSFDDLDADLKKYQYTIVHCNADWMPSDLNKADYLDGFTTAYITDALSSVNTLQPYTHYRCVFPNIDIKPKLSGNYLLKVFVENEDNIIITRRFMVVDTKISINATVKQATVIEDKNFKQEINFNVLHNAYRILNPYQNLKVVLMQNERWDNVISNLKPSLVRNNELIYEYEIGNVFQGDNEYRHIDMKSLKYFTENIERIQLNKGAYHVHMKKDERRSFKRYITQNDINGRYAIKNDDGRDSRIDAEYCHVYFYLPYQAPLIHGSVYVFGALTDWAFNDNNKMIYNFANKTYERALYLKQGYYNYQYAFLENGQTSGDISFIEGTHSQTENDYTILVYYKEVNENYDRLIGVKFLNSVK